jgi:hypothetical protein
MRSSSTKGLAAAIDVIEDGVLSADLGRMLRPHMARVHWDAVVGPQVAAATQVIAVRNGDTLVVRTKNNVWANELSLLKRDILKRLNRAVGGAVLTDIRFDVGTLEPAARPAVDRHPLPGDGELDQYDVPVDAGQRIVDSSAGISDPALQAVVRRSLLRAAQADAWKRARGWLPCTRCNSLAQASGESPHLCPVCKLVPVSR